MIEWLLELAALFGIPTSRLGEWIVDGDTPVDG